MSTTGAPQSRQGAFDPEAALAALAAGSRGERLLHVHEVPCPPGPTASWPQWVHPAVGAAFAGAGVGELWSHQREAADLAHGGSHVVMATGTASGKRADTAFPCSARWSRAQAPNGRGATALYLSPTKRWPPGRGALAIPGLRSATYDGDTPQEERRWIRDHAQLVLTNPDLVHHWLLPQHQRWAPFPDCATWWSTSARLPRRVRLARRAAASAASCGRSLRAEPTFCPGLGHGARPGDARESSGRPARACGGAGRLAPRSHDLRALGARGAPGPGGVPGPGGGPLASTPRARRRYAAAPRARPPTCSRTSSPQGCRPWRSRGPGRGRGPGRQRPSPAARGGPEAGRRGRGIPGRLSARGASGLERSLRDGSLVGLAATNALELASTSAGSTRAAGRLAGNRPRCGSRRAGGPGRNPVARGVRGRRRPARHVPRAPPRRAVRAVGGSDGHGPGQPARAGPAPGRGGCGAAPDRGRPAGRSGPGHAAWWTHSPRRESSGGAPRGGSGLADRATDHVSLRGRDR